MCDNRREMPIAFFDKLVRLAHVHGAAVQLVNHQDFPPMQHTFLFLDRLTLKINDPEKNVAL